MPSSAQVSVVIPAYNAEATIADAVESVLSQSLPPTQVIVVDDGSTDGTADTLAGYGDAITVIRQENMGLARARSAGQAVARGEFIAWLDADDVAFPTRLEAQAAVFEREPEVVVVASDFDAFDASGANEPRYARTYHGAIAEEGSLVRILGPTKSVEAAGRCWTYHAGEARRSLVTGNFVHPPTAMLRRSAVDRVGPLNASFPTSEDWLYFVELSAFGHLAFIDEPLIAYRRSEGQMSGNVRRVLESSLGSLEYVLERYPELSQDDGGRMRRALAHRHRSLAIHLADVERGSAVRHLLAAVRLHRTSPGLAKAVLKVLTPRAVMEGYRRARRPGPVASLGLAIAFGVVG